MCELSGRLKGVTLSVARNKRGLFEEAIKLCRGDEETVYVGLGVELNRCVYGMAERCLHSGECIIQMLPTLGMAPILYKVIGSAF